MALVNQGSEGVRLRIQVLDSIGNVVDVGPATSRTVTLTSPRGRVLVTADLVTDGSDGLIEVGIPDDSWIRASRVDYQVTVDFSGARQVSNVGRITVGPAL